MPRVIDATAMPCACADFTGRKVQPVSRGTSDDGALSFRVERALKEFNDEENMYNEVSREGEDSIISPFVPLPAAAHAAYSQISYSRAQRAADERRNEKKKRGFKGY
ncbi:hypothetical protein EYF80_011570 [Liparis tanakae]|uniref:Uncharacterized protein n=1 Tax=Liparis tanakae TaxID=230148 RepID=A0A4Z2IK02_9TELE|nr:hypothetical protein EYF80_011570 [Liparis tanakae]